MGRPLTCRSRPGACCPSGGPPSQPTRPHRPRHRHTAGPALLPRGPVLAPASGLASSSPKPSSLPEPDREGGGRGGGVLQAPQCQSRPGTEDSDHHDHQPSLCPSLWGQRHGLGPAGHWTSWEARTQGIPVSPSMGAARSTPPELAPALGKGSPSGSAPACPGSGLRVGPLTFTHSLPPHQPPAPRPQWFRWPPPRWSQGPRAGALLQTPSGPPWCWHCPPQWPSLAAPSAPPHQPPAAWAARHPLPRLLGGRCS